MNEENPYRAVRAIDGRGVDAFASFPMNEPPRIGLGIEAVADQPAPACAVVYLDLEQTAELIRVLRSVRHAAVMETLSRHPREPFWAALGWALVQGLAGGVSIGMVGGMFVGALWLAWHIIGGLPFDMLGGFR